jgi:hypothetical protein
MRESSILAAARRQTLAAAPMPAILAAGILFLGVALWNRFPLMFYDTGAYLTEGLEGAFLVERSPVYSLLLLFTGAHLSLWPVVILQAAMTGYLMWEVALAEAPRLALWRFVAVAAALITLTGIGWYVGQVEPDCMTPLVVLGAYLLLFRGKDLGAGRRRLVIAITGLAVACHPSHLGLIGGLLLAAALLMLGRRLVRAGRVLPAPSLLPGLWALVLALLLTVASNYALARSVFISRSGPVFVFARLMQDGIVQKLMDDTCPGSGYRLCAYRKHLPRNANEWLWGANSAFHAQGGFQGSQAEASRIIADSLERYPWLQVKMAIRDSVEQFFDFKTGDGIESQVWILKPGFQRMLPGQLPAYLTARQQTHKFRFQPLNLVHVTAGMLSLLALLLLLNHVMQRRRWDEGVLPALVLLALVGNAIICGTFSNPHDRYQSRLIWLPVFVVLLTLARDPGALRPTPERGS